MRLFWYIVTAVAAVGVVLAYMEPATIYVTIDRDDDRAKYLEVLFEAGIAYRVDKSGRIIIRGMGIQELDKATSSYDEFIEEDMKRYYRERLKPQ